MRQIPYMIGLLWSVTPVVAAAPGPTLAAGDQYEITRTSESVHANNDSLSSGSSSDRDTITERVVAVRDGGLEMEYDLPAGATAQDRANAWQFPARILKSAAGPARLLNAAELEARVDGWLKAGKLPRAACGHWFFTWNAFKIECDPASALRIIDGFDPGPDDLRVGREYREEGALAAVPLKTLTAGGSGSVFLAEAKIDPNFVRRSRAESDVVLAEISRKTLSFDAAFAAQARSDISGNITTTFETDSTGRAYRKTVATTIEIKGANGKVETQTARTVITRRKITRPTAKNAV